MDKENRQSEYKKFSKKDMILIIVATLAVVVLIIFLVVAQKKQRAEQELLDEQGNAQLEEYENLQSQEESALSLKINEVNAGGFVEIYNTGSEVVSLNGYMMNANGVTTTFDANLEIESNGFCVIKIPEGLLNDGNDVIEIATPDGIVLDRVVVPILDTNESFAREEDGMDYWNYYAATKNESNTGAAVQRKDFPVFSLLSGFYAEDTEVEIIAPEGSTVYYTTDGTTPTRESSLYENALPITNVSGNDNVYSAIDTTSLYSSYAAGADVDKGTILRAVAIDKEGNASEIVTASYFVGIGEKTAYAGMPVVSIVTEPSGLFDYYDGIYVTGVDYENALAADVYSYNSANYYRGTTVEATIQYYEADKMMSMDKTYTMRLLIDNNLDMGQKGFYLSNESDSIILQSGGADYGLKDRQILVTALMESTASDGIKVQPCIAFLDGEYWGMYLMQEEYNTTYVADLYGLNQDGVEVVQNGYNVDDREANEGFQSFYMAVANGNMADDSYYNSITEQMDIQSYLDYYCANIYIANSEFDTLSAYAWKYSGDDGSGYNDGKWRFAMGNAENSLALNAVNSYSINTFLRPSVAEDAFLNSLMKNAGFQEQFLETMQTMAEEVFEPEIAKATLDNISTLYMKADMASLIRFTLNVSQAWYEELTDDMVEFFANRSQYILHYAEEYTPTSIDIQADENEDETNQNAE